MGVLLQVFKELFFMRKFFSSIEVRKEADFGVSSLLAVNLLSFSVFILSIMYYFTSRNDIISKKY